MDSGESDKYLGEEGWYNKTALWSHMRLEQFSFEFVCSLVRNRIKSAITTNIIDLLILITYSSRAGNSNKVTFYEILSKISDWFANDARTKFDWLQINMECSLRYNRWHICDREFFVKDRVRPCMSAHDWQPLAKVKCPLEIAMEDRRNVIVLKAANVYLFRHGGL